MFHRIESYHDDLGQRRAFATTEQQMESARTQALALMMEVAELVDSFPWKPWREVVTQTWDEENIKREVVDILFFLVGFCEVFNIRPHELMDKFDEVLKNNYLRLTNGYSKVGYGKGGDVECPQE